MLPECIWTRGFTGEALSHRTTGKPTNSLESFKPRLRRLKRPPSHNPIVRENAKRASSLKKFNRLYANPPILAPSLASHHRPRLSSLFWDSAKSSVVHGRGSRNGFTGAATRARSKCGVRVYGRKIIRQSRLVVLRHYAEGSRERGNSWRFGR